MPVDGELLKILACPLCKSPVVEKPAADSEQDVDGWLVCEKCGRNYPVRGDMPVMLVEEADLPESGE